MSIVFEDYFHTNINRLLSIDTGTSETSVRGQR